MVVLDIGHHSHVRPQPQEGPVVLIGLNHEVFAGSGPGIATQIRLSPADDERRICPQTPQQVGDQRCRGRLAVGPGHRHDDVPGGELA
jgi:hypothetical protein